MSEFMKSKERLMLKEQILKFNWLRLKINLFQREAERQEANAEKKVQDRNVLQLRRKDIEYWNSIQKLEQEKTNRWPHY